MGREQTFLERLDRVGQGERITRIAEEDVHELVDSVCRHLVRLLNSRHGMCEALDDYGLPAMADVLSESPEHAQWFTASMARSIRKYEPRLRDVQVTLTEARRDEDDHKRPKQAFTIDAVLAGQSTRRRLQLKATINPEGRIEVRA